MDSNATPRGGQGKRESARTFGEAAGKAAGRGGQDSGHTNTTTRQGKARQGKHGKAVSKNEEGKRKPWAARTSVAYDYDTKYSTRGPTRETWPRNASGLSIETVFHRVDGENRKYHGGIGNTGLARIDMQ
ncbi:hypothetical protein V493_02420 [Pseudogymnoascus sp. VKM F-4281 (FW-2241)]|nr:hypothetical protein V493_02420 [Pseudogymnoascus sp. VKM F-4281 (FW-2241)]